jgi:hypothetical protein
VCWDQYQLAKSRAAPRDRDYQKIDAIVINQFPGRLAKLQAPEFAHPVGQLAPPEALDRLIKNCARLTEHLESAPDLREHALDAPPLKAVSQGAYESMDGYQWLLAAAAHTERHIKQILEVRADPNFPEIKTEAAPDGSAPVEEYEESPICSPSRRGYSTSGSMKLACAAWRRSSA